MPSIDEDELLAFQGRSYCEALEEIAALTARLEVAEEDNRRMTEHIAKRTGQVTQARIERDEAVEALRLTESGTECLCPICGYSAFEGKNNIHAENCEWAIVMEQARQRSQEKVK